MGLDITAYGALKKIATAALAPDDEGLPQTVWISPALVRWTEDNWAGRTAGIETGAVCTFGATLSFRAGSYGSYGIWRDALAQLAGFKSAAAVWDVEAPAGPFVELINFADNQGFIGSVVAGKLAADFAEHQARALTHGDDWWRRQYLLWRSAFELAAHDGLVEFH